MDKLSRSSLSARFALALALMLACGTALAKMSECQADCETRYKNCMSTGRMTEAGCRTELEKCRKKCSKAPASSS